MERTAGVTVTDARFEEVRRGFEALGEALSDDQLLALADTYHEILRLRRCRRATRERLGGAAPLAAAS